MAKPMFEVSTAGLRKLVEGRHPKFIASEVIANAWDTEGGAVRITFQHLPGDVALLVVEDDDPDGFKQLSDAYTVFAESTRKADATKRGRFGLGEKLAIAACVEASIETTTGSVKFDDAGRHERRGARDRRERGSLFSGRFRCTKKQFRETLALIQLMRTPEGVHTTLNGLALINPTPVHTFEDTLPTLAANGDGVLRPTNRKVVVRIYQPLEDEKAHLFELGIPVVATGDRWHVDVQQKVPLNADRDNVTPAYLRDVRAAVLNHCHDLLTADDGGEKWLDDAMLDDSITAEAIGSALDARFGKDRVSLDLSDQEANKIAASKGFTVVASRSLPKGVWEKVREHDLIKPAGQVTPSPKAYFNSEQAATRDEIPEAEWSDGMRNIAAMTAKLSEDVTGSPCRVSMVNDPQVMNFVAAFGSDAIFGDRFEYNVRRLGRAWFDQPFTSEKVLELFIHEVAHHYSSDHLSGDYYDACCKVGARLARLAMDGKLDS